MFLLFEIAFIQSGIIRFSDQSPPPITLPALTEAAPKLSLSLKNDLKYDENTPENTRILLKHIILSILSTDFYNLPKHVSTGLKNRYA
jgi:hypothetical protein